MEDWFTTEWVDEGTAVISEYQHWEETHCYLVIGDERALLIDTGDTASSQPFMHTGQNRRGWKATFHCRSRRCGGCSARTAYCRRTSI